MFIRDRPRFFDQVGHQTTFAYVGNKHFFTKSCHHQTYQRLQNLYFQSHFSASKINQIFLIFFSERFDQFLTQKNDFESTNFEMFEEVVHNFGKSDDDMI